MIKRVGLIIHREFDPEVTDDQRVAQTYVNEEFAEGAALLNEALEDGYTVIAHEVVTLQKLIFMYFVLYKSDKEIKS